MKAWMALSDGVEVTAQPNDTNALLACFVHSFYLKPKFWSAVGKRRPGICQFSLAGSDPDSWYIALDETGGEVRRGLHPSPNTTWRSDASALLSIMKMEVRGGDLVRSGKVALTGDLPLLHELLEALES